MVGALLLPSFSPSLFLSSPPLSTSKRRGGPARGRRASPPLLFSRLSSPPHPLPCMLPCSTASFYFVQPSQLSQLTLPPFAIKDKFKARQARAKLVILNVYILIQPDSLASQPASQPASPASPAQPAQPSQPASPFRKFASCKMLHLFNLRFLDFDDFDDFDRFFEFLKGLFA